VQNEKHWKGPIDKVVVVGSLAELAAIGEAVDFYTATKITARLQKADQTRGFFAYHVTAPGYWAGPAA